MEDLFCVRELVDLIFRLPFDKFLAFKFIGMEIIEDISFSSQGVRLEWEFRSFRNRQIPAVCNPRNTESPNYLNFGSLFQENMHEHLKIHILIHRLNNRPGSPIEYRGVEV